MANVVTKLQQKKKRIAFLLGITLVLSLLLLSTSSYLFAHAPASSIKADPTHNSQVPTSKSKLVPSLAPAFTSSSAPPTTLAAVGVGINPVGVAFDPGNGNLYVTNSGSNTVSVISSATNTVTAAIPVGTQPIGVAFDAANSNIYVANYGDGTVSVIGGTTNTVLTTISIGSGTSPDGVAFDPANNNMYVANFGLNTVSVIGS